MSESKDFELEFDVSDDATAEEYALPVASEDGPTTIAEAFPELEQGPALSSFALEEEFNEERGSQEIGSEQLSIEEDQSPSFESVSFGLESAESSGFSMELDEPDSLGIQEPPSVLSAPTESGNESHFSVGFEPETTQNLEPSYDSGFSLTDEIASSALPSSSETDFMQSVADVSGMGAAESFVTKPPSNTSIVVPEKNSPHSEYVEGSTNGADSAGLFKNNAPKVKISNPVVSKYSRKIKRVTFLILKLAVLLLGGFWAYENQEQILSLLNMTETSEEQFEVAPVKPSSRVVLSQERNKERIGKQGKEFQKSLMVPFIAPQLDAALIMGDIQGAEASYQALMQKKENSLFLEIAQAEALTRLRILKGQTQDLSYSLAPYCKAEVLSARSCLHYLRSLIIEGSGADSRYIFKLKEALKNERVHYTEDERADLELLSDGPLNLMERVVALQNDRQLKNLQNFWLSLSGIPELTPEWKRQKASWVSYNTMLFTTPQLVETLKQMPMRSIRNLETYLTGISTHHDSFEISLFSYLFFKAEMSFLESKIKVPPHSPYWVPTGFYHAVVRSAYKPSSLILADTGFLKDIHEELFWIMNIRFRAQEKNTYAGLLLVKDFKKKFPRPQYMLEWVIAQCQLALSDPRENELISALGLLQNLKKKESRYQRNFAVLFLEAKLLRHLKRDPSAALQKAHQLAQSHHEKALVALEEIEFKLNKESKRSAYEFGLVALKKYPHHVPLISRTANLGAELGVDLHQFQKRLKQTPMHLWTRFQELPLLSDETLRRVVFSGQHEKI